MTVSMMICRLSLAEAASNTEIEQQLAKPWSEDQVEEAFTSTLAGWKARHKSKRLKGNCTLIQLSTQTILLVHLFCGLLRVNAQVMASYIQLSMQVCSTAGPPKTITL